MPGSTVTPEVADIGYAQLDLTRGARCGAGEVVYGEGKTAEQVAGIVDALIAAGQRHVLVTRLSAEKFERARELMDSDTPLEYHADARIAIAGGMPVQSGNGTIVVACAGTSDLPVAEIAHRVGYEDPSRFAAAFRRHTGRRPTELRRVACPTVQRPASGV